MNHKTYRLLQTGMGPRSRLPLSPSMEARLSDDTSASQDSLVSTGSNQELKTQLDTTLAEVEAITTQLEKQNFQVMMKSRSHQFLRLQQ